MTVEQFVSKVHDLGYDSEILDDLVHEVASQIASNVNNEGVAGQVEYLKSHGWSEQAILDWLTESYDMDDDDVA